MKVAVDVKGTLEGPRRKQIVEIIKFLLNRGDQVVVWSNGLGRQGAEGLLALESQPLNWLSALRAR